MAEFVEKCAVCRGLLDPEDLFCSNCGREAPLRADRTSPEEAKPVHSFACAGCGASMHYDPSAASLRCPFCGSEDLKSEEDPPSLAPQKVLPFRISREEALARLQQWLRQGFFRPGDLAAKGVVTVLSPTYVPFWAFSAKTFTHWTADTSRTHPGARANWRPISGERHGQISGLLVGGSSALTPLELASLSPFDLAPAIAPEEADFTGTVCEQFRVSRKYARPLAKQGIEQREREECAKLVPGSCRNLHVNVRIEDQTSEPILAPVWIAAYQYRDRLFRFLVNGQTGQATGETPVSWLRVAAAILAGGAALAAILVILAALLR